MTPTPPDPALIALTDKYFDAQRDRNYRRMDRTFAVLMVVQWVAGILVALWLSPWTYVGRVASIHPHVYQALFGGALLTAAPVALALLRPGRASTRQVITVAQMMFSALLIHLTGGRVETHFHIFGSLAFVAFYRDWRLLPTATVAVAAEHLFTGWLAPISVYGVLNPEWWRFLEHAFWVVFEDMVLLMSCLRGVEEMRETALRRAEAEALSSTLDVRVQERTQELMLAYCKLEESAQKEQETQRQLVETSRKAGMADVATAVLHNVGNVLNSVNVSSSLIGETLRKSKVAGIAKLTALMAQDDIAPVMASHPKTKQIPPYLAQVGESLSRDQEHMLKELEGLQRNIEHIKVIVSMQQTHAKGGKGTRETLSLKEVVEEALSMNALSYEKHQLKVESKLEAVSRTLVDRHQVLQIILNLLSNARHAVKDRPVGEGRIDIRLREEGGAVRLDIADSGCGIPKENLDRVFNHGFTTKVDGHGFGLHSSACAAKDLGGSLTCHSDGVGKGAVFTLSFPCEAMKAAA